MYYVCHRVCACVSVMMCACVLYHDVSGVLFLYCVVHSVCLNFISQEEEEGREKKARKTQRTRELLASCS